MYDIKEQVIKQVFLTHVDMDDDDISFVSKFVYDMNMDKLAKVLTCLNRTSYSGYFCLSFNDLIDIYIRGRDANELCNLLDLDINEVFEECYQNFDLNKIEKESIDHQYRQEAMAMAMLLNRSNITEEHLLYDETNIINGFIVDNEMNTHTAYHNCYIEVCSFESAIIKENVLIHDDSNLVNMTITIPVKNEDGVLFTIRGYRLIELLELYYKHGISSETRLLIKDRFSKELKMYDFYKSNHFMS